MQSLLSIFPTKIKCRRNLAFQDLPSPGTRDVFGVLADPNVQRVAGVEKNDKSRIEFVR